jgi:DNA invertase Pin-like site-specific DNA recombinase
MTTLEQAAGRRDRLRTKHAAAEREADRQLVEIIRRDLATGVNATAIANRIGVSRPTLYRLLREHPATNDNAPPATRG